MFVLEVYNNKAYKLFLGREFLLKSTCYREDLEKYIPSNLL